MNHYDAAEAMLADPAGIETLTRAVAHAVLAVVEKLDAIDDRLIELGNAVTALKGVTELALTQIDNTLADRPRPR